MEQNFSSVWFATEQQIRSRTRFFNFSDRGSLSFSPEKLQFTGRKYNLRIKDIKTVDIIYPQIPWISNILSIIFSLIFLGLITWILDGPEAIAMPVAIIFTVYFILFVPFATLIQKVMLWVEVVYADDENVLQKAYFLDGSLLGWGGILGGTLKMYKELRPSARKTA